MKRKFHIQFETDEEYTRFMEWVNSEELDKTEGIERSRKLLQEMKEQTERTT